MVYAFTAAALGAGWFLVLLVPPATREWLVANIAQNLACLMVASVVVAVACRRYILGAGSRSGHALRAVALPYLGCLVFLTLTAAVLWTRSLVQGGLANVHDTLSLYAMGLTATTTSLYVVVPYGLLCQYAMSWVGHRTGNA
jgi:hypothetical protein